MNYIHNVIRSAIINLDDLTLAKGISFEVILEKLRANGIDHRVSNNPMASEGFFRQSSIDVTANKWADFLKLFGRPHACNRNCNFYYGLYVVGKNFDLSQLNGKISFDEGKLVERTDIRYSVQLQKSPS